MTYIDYSVYPDLPEASVSLETIEDKADYVHRICTAWDFHIHPDPETFALFREWKEVFDRFPVLTSPAYHAFRAGFGWAPLKCPAGVPGPRPLYVLLDQQEGRDEDPCEQLI